MELHSRCSLFEGREGRSLTNLADTSPTASDIRFTVVPKQSKASWKVGVNYQLNDDILLYTSAASGNLALGYNPGHCR